MREPLTRIGAGWIDGLRRDIRHSARILRKSPGFTFVAVTALAVGIGANLTIFGFVNSLLLRALPVSEPSRLIRADLGGSNVLENSVPFDDYLEYRDRNQTLSRLLLFHPGGVFPVRARQRPAEPIHVMPVTGNYFETLGIRAAIGRTFSMEEDRRDSGAVVLSQEGWKRHFDSDPSIVGQTLLINGVPFVVVGVTPASFTGTVPPVVPRMYATWQAVHLPLPGSPRGYMIGRLGEGQSLDSARADFARIATQLQKERSRPVSVAVYPATINMPGTQRVFSLFGALFMLIVAAVLWVACSNIAILQLVRSAARRREMELRLALGATRSDLLRQSLTENLLLAVLAGAIALALATATAGWLTQMPLPVPMPISLTFALDWHVVAFALTLSLVVTLLSGLGSALTAQRSSPTGVLHYDSGGSAHPVVRKSLVVTQVGLSTVLLVLAVALTRSVIAPQERRLDANGVLIATVSLPKSQYAPDQVQPFFERLLSAAEASRGVEAATLVETIPLAINRPLSSVEIARDENVVADSRSADTKVLANHVSRGHFTTLGIPLAQGRDFRAQDDNRASRVAIVNETLARRAWRGESPIGQQLRVGSAEWVTIIAVARDSKYESVVEDPKPMLYLPFAQAQSPYEGTLLIKVRGEARSAAGLARALVADIDPGLVVSNLNTLEDRLALSLLPNRAAALTSGILGVLALALGTIGTYSVMAFLVLQRRREIGIRIALGALPAAVIRMFSTQGMRWIGAGLAVGTVLAIGALRLLQGLVFGISAWDPVSVGGVLLLLGATGYAACYLPAFTTCRRNPVAVLRE